MAQNKRVMSSSLRLKMWGQTTSST